jgi:esterase/lipase superfamily enzyme
MVFIRSSAPRRDDRKDFLRLDVSIPPAQDSGEVSWYSPEMSAGAISDFKLSAVRHYLARPSLQCILGSYAMKRLVKNLVFAAVPGLVKWGAGPIEGHINRLKMLKRQMYG